MHQHIPHLILSLSPLNRATLSSVGANVAFYNTIELDFYVLSSAMVTFGRSPSPVSLCSPGPAFSVRCSTEGTRGGFDSQVDSSLSDSRLDHVKSPRESPSLATFQRSLQHADTKNGLDEKTHQQIRLSTDSLPQRGPSREVNTTGQTPKSVNKIRTEDPTPNSMPSLESRGQKIASRRRKKHSEDAPQEPSAELHSTQDGAISASRDDLRANFLSRQSSHRQPAWGSIREEPESRLASHVEKVNLKTENLESRTRFIADSSFSLSGNRKVDYQASKPIVARSRPIQTPPTSASFKKATKEDVEKHQIPKPILLLGGVFGGNSLGKWIYDWAVFHHGLGNPISEMAHDLWQLLIQLISKKDFSEACFIEGGERLLDKLNSLLKRYEGLMPKPSKRKGTTQLGEKECVEFLRSTKRFMRSMRLWNLRFDANCHEILIGSTITKVEGPGATRHHSSEAQAPVESKDNDSLVSSLESHLTQACWTEATENEYTDDSSSDFMYSSCTSDDETLDNEHPLRQEVPSLVQIALEEYGKQRGNSEQRSSTGSNDSKELSGSSKSFSKSQKRNRTRQQGGGMSSGEEDSRNTKYGKKSRLSDVDDKSLLLACPYYKKDKFKHKLCLRDFKLKRIKDVKQHLCRKHIQPHFCPLCGQEFETKGDERDHIRTQSCSRQEYQEPEGITDDHKDKFSSRWFTVWDIVFPDTPRPSSAYVQDPEIETLLEMVANHERDIAALFTTVGSPSDASLLDETPPSLITDDVLTHAAESNSCERGLEQTPQGLAQYHGLEFPVPNTTLLQKDPPTDEVGFPDESTSDFTWGVPPSEDLTTADWTTIQDQ
ncbi:hypothetical protein BGZ61DRAFT_467387 [Ilyonectria robusta]|uniref:uncharacterized protein n=1 Tax=Ilyonectria robusta TaxID=1079257 RepID=UPI001E8CA8FB|nr:uncharacterized protein BGZ61DRAFT_467387 [Ilyonectria robusta]KAH8654759.1 hypothetical protein BGZ61DRAFT_467387 [Ilyonectria robusta]